VPAGPFELANFRVISGAGEARVVLKDTLGREIQTTLPFYTSSELLRQGLVDFSAEIGFPRRNHGTESSDYASDIMGTATVRYGLTDRLTLESHVEGGADLLNGGMGAAFPLGPWGVTSLAVAGSQHDGGTGMLLNGTLELSFGDFSIYGRMQHTFGAYDDIASVPADVERQRQFFYPGMGGFFSARVPRSLAQVSLSAPVFDRANINLSFAQSEYDNGEKSRIVSASYGQSFFRNTSFYASAFKDLDEGDSFGIYAGLSISFDNGINVSTDMEQTPDGLSGGADISKSSTQEEGSYGWRANAREGNFTNRSVAANYRSTYARVEGQVQQYDDAVRASAWVDGAIAVAGAASLPPTGSMTPSPLSMSARRMST
jgi:outer membrane usher protein